MKKVFLAALASVASVVLTAQEPTQPQTVTLTLDQAIEIALDENPTIKVADMEIERQDYVRKETVGNLLPSLSASGQYSYSIIKQKMSKSGLSFGADNTVTLGANLTVPLFVPAVYASLKLNDAQMAEAVESARSSRVTMVNEVRKAFYNMLLLQESLAVLRESEKIMQETVDNTRMMYEAELGSEYDYITAQSNLSAIMPNIIQTEGSIQVADFYMHMLLSLPNDVAIELVGDLDSYSGDIINRDGSYSTDISNNSDLKLLDIQERMLEAQLKVTNAQRMPTLSAFGSFSLYGNDMPEINFGDIAGSGSAANSAKQFWWQHPASVGVSISIPIFSGNKINNQAKQAKIAIDQLRMQRVYTEESTNMQVRTSISNLVTALSKMKANETSMAQARKAYDITNARYTGGAGTILELNSAQLQLTQARLNYTQAIYDYLAAEADYEKIIGRDYVPASDEER
ncbi:MAG TPA: TolC family protein [Candidatus Tidjanibacter gallistercoris]|nr:TolC family protein [Candidatus Tidjanibacter gallistercoris]